MARGRAWSRKWRRQCDHAAIAVFLLVLQEAEVADITASYQRLERVVFAHLLSECCFRQDYGPLSKWFLQR